MKTNTQFHQKISSLEYFRSIPKHLWNLSLQLPDFSTPPPGFQEGLSKKSSHYLSNPPQSSAGLKPGTSQYTLAKNPSSINCNLIGSIFYTGSGNYNMRSRPTVSRAAKLYSQQTETQVQTTEEHKDANPYHLIYSQVGSSNSYSTQCSSEQIHPVCRSLSFPQMNALTGSLNQTLHFGKHGLL